MSKQEMSRGEFEDLIVNKKFTRSDKYVSAGYICNEEDGSYAVFYGNMFILLKTDILKGNPKLFWSLIEQYRERGDSFEPFSLQRIPNAGRALKCFFGNYTRSLGSEILSKIENKQLPNEPTDAFKRYEDSEGWSVSFENKKKMIKTKASIEMAKKKALLSKNIFFANADPKTLEVARRFLYSERYNVYLLMICYGERMLQVGETFPYLISEIISKNCPEDRRDGIIKDVLDGVKLKEMSKKYGIPYHFRKMPALAASKNKTLRFCIEDDVDLSFIKNKNHVNIAANFLGYMYVHELYKRDPREKPAQIDHYEIVEENEWRRAVDRDDREPEEHSATFCKYVINNIKDFYEFIKESDDHSWKRSNLWSAYGYIHDYYRAQNANIELANKPSFARLYRESTEWHRMQNMINQQYIGGVRIANQAEFIENLERNNDSFPPPPHVGIEIEEDKTKWLFEPITTPLDLYNEGEAMKHCVFSYRDQVERGRVYIYSLKKNGKRCATVEVSVNEPIGGVGNITFFCRQARKEKNHDLSDKENRMLRKIMKKVEKEINQNRISIEEKVEDGAEEKVEHEIVRRDGELYQLIAWA